MKLIIIIISISFANLFFSEIPTNAVKCQGSVNTWNNCVYKFDDGYSYYGAWQDGVRHGKGIFVHEDGRSLEGNWLNGYLYGYAKYTGPKEAGSKVSWDYYLEGVRVTRDQYYDWKYPDLKSNSVTKTASNPEKFNFRDLDSMEKAIFSIFALFILSPMFIFGFLAIRDRINIESNNLNNKEKIDNVSEYKNDDQTTQENISIETDESLIGEESPFEFQNENTMDSSDRRDQKYSDLKTFFGLSLKGWSYLFVFTIIVMEVSSEVYSISRGYSFGYFADRPRFNIMENQLAGIYWAGVLGAIYLVVEYLKPNPPTFQSVDSGNDLGTSDENQQTDDILEQENTLEDRLSSLKELFDKGLISKEVYESKQLDILEDE